jgi:predicted transporter
MGLGYPTATGRLKLPAVEGAIEQQPAEGTIEQQPAAGSFAPRAVLRTAAPRLVRDAVGPLAIFYAGWKLVGLSVGIVSALLFGLAVFTRERRAGRQALIVRVALTFVVIRAIVGLSSGSARVYLAQEIGADLLISCVTLGLLARGRALAAMFAQEVYPLPDELAQSAEFASAMARITLVWGAYFLIRALVRLAAILTLSTDHYVLVSALSEAPFLVAILAWSVHYSARAFRNSARWGPLMASAPAPLATRAP